YPPKSISLSPNSDRTTIGSHSNCFIGLWCTPGYACGEKFRIYCQPAGNRYIPNGDEFMAIVNFRRQSVGRSGTEYDPKPRCWPNTGSFGKLRPYGRISKTAGNPNGHALAAPRQAHFANFPNEAGNQSNWGRMRPIHARKHV